MMIPITTPCSASSPQEMAIAGSHAESAWDRKANCPDKAVLTPRPSQCARNVSATKEPENRRFRSLPCGSLTEEKQSRSARKSGDSQVRRIRAHIGLRRRSRSGQATISVHPRQNRFGGVGFLPRREGTKVELGDEAGFPKAWKVWECGQNQKNAKAKKDSPCRGWGKVRAGYPDPEGERAEERQDENSDLCVGKNEQGICRRAQDRAPRGPLLEENQNTVECDGNHGEGQNVGDMLDVPKPKQNCRGE